MAVLEEKSEDHHRHSASFCGHRINTCTQFQWHSVERLLRYLKNGGVLDVVWCSMVTLILKVLKKFPYWQINVSEKQKSCFHLENVTGHSTQENTSRLADIRSMYFFCA